MNEKHDYKIWFTFENHDTVEVDVFGYEGDIDSLMQDIWNKGANGFLDRNGVAITVNMKYVIYTKAEVIRYPEEEK